MLAAEAKVADNASKNPLILAESLECLTRCTRVSTDKKFHPQGERRNGYSRDLGKLETYLPNIIITATARLVIQYDPVITLD
jgi:hypothetical protein